VLALVEQAVGERLVTCGLRGVGLFDQMRAADDAVLVITEQRLNSLGPFGDRSCSSRGSGVSKSLGAFADSMQDLIVLRGSRGGLGSLRGLANLLVGSVDVHRSGRLIR
jgi:hypothetical protein